MDSFNDTLEEIRKALDLPDIMDTRLADGSGVLMNIESRRVVSLNETGLFLLDNIRDGRVGVEQLVEKLTEEFIVSSKDAEEDVKDFIQEISVILKKS